ncbi:MAG: hypothetical protein AB1546_10560, partial [bacterium]
VWGVRPSGGGDPVNPANWPSGQAKGSGTLQSAPVFALNKLDPAAENADNDYEWELCIRCHSSYSWYPTGAPFTGPNALTDISREINPNNIAHHAIVAKGNNQSVNATYLGAYTFANPTSATIYCSDCHSRSQSGDPQGPHGTSNKWILGTWCETNPANYGATPPDCGDAHQTVICFKCHRFRVYYNGEYSAGNYGSRITHPMNANHVDNTANVFGIWCLTCHAGGVEGGIHGTNAAVGSKGVDPLGRHFMNGASLVGFSEDVGSSKFTCWTKSATDAYMTVNCSKHDKGRTEPFNYNY